jgi:ABC-type bacteriocin/lantibiotic exporter with double-glycine peptidase domain
MKQLAIVVIGITVLGGIAFFYPSTIEHTNTEPQVVEKEVEVDALEQAVKTAQDVAKNAITETAQQAYDAAYAQEMKKIELQVITDFNKKLDARQIELEKETGL